jgi:hypothetical protein
MVDFRGPGIANLETADTLSECIHMVIHATPDYTGTPAFYKGSILTDLLADCQHIEGS